MSLNEIVNCPAKFVSSSPYLVVQHVDWIQCRYLLVHTAGASNDELRRTDKDARYETPISEDTCPIYLESALRRLGVHFHFLSM